MNIIETLQLMNGIFQKEREGIHKKKVYLKKSYMAGYDKALTFAICLTSHFYDEAKKTDLEMTAKKGGDIAADPSTKVKKIEDRKGPELGKPERRKKE